jgi:hypothetical protein
MDLAPYVDDIQRRLALAADAGGNDARALADRLLPALDAALQLALQDALAAAAEEITTELAPGSVELRLRGRSPEFVVTPPPAPDAADAAPARVASAPVPVEPDDGAVARINLRLPEQLKARAEQAAAAEGLSVNTWLVRAATAALEPRDPAPARAPQGGRRYTGWAR